MSMRFPAGLASLVVTAGVTIAGIETHSIGFDFNPIESTTILDVPGFNTQGGLRRLDAVVMNFAHNFEVTVSLESTGPTPIAEGDFVVSAFVSTIFQFGVSNGGDDEFLPFFGPGAFSTGDITAALGAYDGVPGEPGPDYYTQDFTDSFTNSWRFDETEGEDVLQALTDVAVLPSVFGGFAELFGGFVNDPMWPLPGEFFPNYPTDAAIWVSFESFRYSGTIDLTYEYTIVPAPATVGVGMALLGPLLRRRRGERDDRSRLSN